MKYFFPALLLIASYCQAQHLVYNIDLTRGNGNQWIYIDEPKSAVIPIPVNTGIRIDSSLTLIKDYSSGDSSFSKKKAFYPTPESASKAGLLMKDSVIDGKPVMVIREDMSNPNGYKSIGDSGQFKKVIMSSEDVILGSSARTTRGVGYVRGTMALGQIDVDKPKPGEKLHLCPFCDMMRTIAHIKYIAQLRGMGYVEISKGIWVCALK